MQKILKKFMAPLLTFLIICTMSNNALAAPITFNLSSEIGEFSYKGDTYGVKKITENLTNEVAYCLEINDDYPKEDGYTELGKSSENVSKILEVGYPLKTGADLGVDNDNEAYLATQIVLWASIEGFDVNQITTPNKKTQKAIVNIYNTAKSVNSSSLAFRTVTPSNKSVQDLVLTNPTIVEEKTPKLQVAPIEEIQNHNNIKELG